jgi:hypothetical protein
MKKYAIVIEQGANNLSAWVPDLLDGLREDGEPIPEPHTAVTCVELVAP